MTNAFVDSSCTRVLPPVSRRFTPGHTWDGAPLSCAVGIAVLDAPHGEDLVDRVAARGPQLRDELDAALKDIPVVKEVRGHGFFRGVDYVDPRHGESFLPADLRVAGESPTAPTSWAS